MRRPYVLAPAADRDVDEQFLYIAERSREAAVRFLQVLDTTLERLAGLRVWQVQGFENYLIFYRPVERGIEVLRVLHAARDIAAVFDNPA